MAGTFPVAPWIRRKAEGPGGNLGGSAKSELEGSHMSNHAYIDGVIAPRFEYRLRRKLSIALGKEGQSCKNL